MTGAPAIGFRYHPSRWMRAATLAVALLALAAVWAGAGPRWARLAASLCIAACAGAGLGGLLRPPVRALLWRADGGVDLVLDDRMADSRREVQGGLQTTRVLGPLIVLTVRWPPRERAHLWILPDNLDAETRRRLRIRAGAEGGTRVSSGNADTH